MGRSAPYRQPGIGADAPAGDCGESFPLGRVYPELPAHMVLHDEPAGSFGAGSRAGAEKAAVRYPGPGAEDLGGNVLE